MIGFIGAINAVLRDSHSRPIPQYLDHRWGGKFTNPFGIGDPHGELEFHCRPTGSDNRLDVIPVAEQAEHIPGFMEHYRAWTNQLCAALHMGFAQPFVLTSQDRYDQEEAFDTLLEHGEMALCRLSPPSADRLARRARLEMPRRDDVRRARVEQVLAAWEASFTPEGVRRLEADPAHILPTRPDPRRMLRAAGFDDQGKLTLSRGSRSYELIAVDPMTCQAPDAKTREMRLEVARWQGDYPLWLTTDDPRDVVAFVQTLDLDLRLSVREGREMPGPETGDCFEHNGMDVRQPWGMTDPEGEVDYDVDIAGKRLHAPPLVTIGERVGGDFHAKYLTWRNRLCAEILLAKREPFSVTSTDRLRWENAFSIIHHGGIEAVRRMSPEAADRIVREAKLAMRDKPLASPERMRVAAAIREGLKPSHDHTSSKPEEPVVRPPGIR